MTTPPRFEMEVVREVWDNELTGECFEIGPDRDGLDMVEIRYKNEKGQILQRMSFVPEQAILVATALERCAGELRFGTVNMDL